MNKKEQFSYLPFRLLGLLVLLFSFVSIFIFALFAVSSDLISSNWFLVYKAIATAFFVVLTVFGLGLLFFPSSLIDLFFFVPKKENMLEIWLRIAGNFFVISGFFNLFLYSIGVYRILCNQNSFLYFTLLVLSFLLIYIGFFLARFRDWIGVWIREGLSKEE